jgi:flavin-dependent dehydrogenase
MAGSFDAIVVGASFAGLAVARQLHGHVLLIDRNDVGAVQTSACGTPLWIAEALGVTASVLQVHDRLYLRTPRRTITYDLSDVPFCTFDYQTFCRGLLDQTRARFLRAGVTGVVDGAVLTTEGRFTAPVIVDCSGWRAAVVGSAAALGETGRSGAAGHGAGGYSFGLETWTPRDDRGLWLVLDESVIPAGLGWIFPVGSGSLIGLGSYLGRSKLRPPLDRWLEAVGERGGTYHGTYFPNRLLRPTSGRVFAVGDAAGQCLPLTAEGIRPAIYFGTQCGRLVQRVLDGATTLEAALGQYQTIVDRYRGAYRVLRAVQWMAARAPSRWFALLADLAGHRPLAPRWWPRYGWFGRLDEPMAAGA